MSQNASQRELTLIVAATNKMGIGKAGSLPWVSLRKEMAYFARVTKRVEPMTSNAVLMGRKTWESIPPSKRPLKDRTNIVLTRTGGSFGDDICTAHNFDTALRLLEPASTKCKAFVIGGAQIYREALQREETKRILLTRILGDFECDTMFPIELEESGRSKGWERRSKAEHDAWVGETVPEGVQEEHGTEYVFEMWERRNNP